MTRRPTQRRTLGLESLESRQLLSTTTLPGGPTREEAAEIALINRARVNPQAVANQYSVSLDADGQDAALQYGLDLPTVRDVINSATPQQPMAYDATLTDVARAQSQFQADNNVQQHTDGAGRTADVRAAAAGFKGSVAENIFAYGNSPKNIAEAFMADWGYKAQDGPHRKNILQFGTAPKDGFNKTGVGIVDKNVTLGGTGPLVATELLGKDNSGPFLVGTAFRDGNGNGIYDDPSEGTGGVSIQVINKDTGEVVSTAPYESGLWQAEVQPNHPYEVKATAIDGRLVADQVVPVGTMNVLFDINYDNNAQPLNSAPPAPSQPSAPPSQPPAPPSRPSAPPSGGGVVAAQVLNTSSSPLTGTQAQSLLDQVSKLQGSTTLAATRAVQVPTTPPPVVVTPPVTQAPPVVVTPPVTPPVAQVQAPPPVQAPPVVTPPAPAVTTTSAPTTPTTPSDAPAPVMNPSVPIFKSGLVVSLKSWKVSSES